MARIAGAFAGHGLQAAVLPAGQYEYIQNGDVSQPIAGTYHRVDANQQSIFDVILASFHGFYEAVEISLFILMVGGFSFPST